MAAEKTDQETPSWTGREQLVELDPDIKEIIGKEKRRQVMGLELIASEVGGTFTCAYTGAAVINLEVVEQWPFMYM